jgi:UDP-galactopyranose mutase
MSSLVKTITARCGARCCPVLGTSFFPTFVQPFHKFIFSITNMLFFFTTTCLRLIISLAHNFEFIKTNGMPVNSVRIVNSTFERVEEFKYLGTTLTNQNSIAGEIKSRLRSGNACYHSVQNLLSSRLLFKNYRSRYVVC